MIRSPLLRCIGVLLLGVFWLVACDAPNSDGTAIATGLGAPGDAFADLAQALPGDGDIPGWTASGDAAMYDEETLFELVNGQADAFFAYNFQQVAVQSYESDGANVLRVEIWELATPADAYGLFTRNAAGTPPATAVGNDADVDPGRRLAFWQDRYYVQIRTREPVADRDLGAAGVVVSRALPVGGERPSLVDALPAEGRMDRGHVFFRHEISIQDEVWLGGENVLGLGSETYGVLAHYDIAGTPSVLLLVQYPSTADAEAAVRRLPERGIADLAGAEVNGTRLAALFGSVDVEIAGEWLVDVALEP